MNRTPISCAWSLSLRLNRALVPPLRLGLCLVMALALTMAGVWSAQACAAREGLVRMVICSHGEMAVVWMDAQGQPAAAPSHADWAKGNGGHCAACLAPPVAALLPVPSLPAWSQQAERLAPAQPPALTLARQIVLAPPARAPPFLLSPARPDGRPARTL